jgi:hypothetical protein
MTYIETSFFLAVFLRRSEGPLSEFNGACAMLPTCDVARSIL